MPLETWSSLAAQIPVVVVFSAIVGYMLKTFLAHIDAQEVRSQQFVKDLTERNTAALERLTDAICGDLDAVAERLQDHVSMAIGHDAFVRTAFKERFGREVMQDAEQAGIIAAAASRVKKPEGKP